MALEATDAAGQAAGLARAALQWELGSEAERRVQALARQGDDARTPAVREATVGLPLSHREREVAILASHGLTNRQVAERLGVSVRTVERHVYRACSRLGLADRAALVAVVAPDSRPPMQ